MEGDIQCRNRREREEILALSPSQTSPWGLPLANPAGSQRTREQPTRVKEIGEGRLKRRWIWGR